jgi:hypothetical protein
MENNELFKEAASNPQGFTPATEISEKELFDIVGSEQPAQTVNPPVNAPNAPQGNAYPLQPQPVEQTINIGSFIDEKVAAEFLDIGMSTVLGICLRQFAGIKASKTALKATDSEKEMLHPPLKEVLRQFNVKVTNPYEALVYAALCIYGSKAAIVVSEESFKKVEAGNLDDLNTLVDGMPKKGRGRPRKI